MTCTVAVSEGNGRAVYLAADTLCHSEEAMLRMGAPKVRAYTLDDGSVLGVGGAGESVTIKVCVDRTLESLELRAPDMALLDEWMQEFAEQWTAEVNALEPRPYENERIDGSLILAYDGQIWFIEQNIAERLRGGYGATGAGIHYALGSLYSTAEYVEDPTERAILAVGAAIQFDKYCGGGIDLQRIAPRSEMPYDER